MNKVLTISIAAYNMERYISQTLNSLLDDKFVNGINLSGICTGKPELFERNIGFVTSSFDELPERSGAVYVHAHPGKHYEII